MAWRIVREAGGRGRIQMIPNRCKYMVMFGQLCLEPVRTKPGAIYCKEHEHLENAGCAAHDKTNCKEAGCR